jgi:hypothetical protein
VYSSGWVEACVALDERCDEAVRRGRSASSRIRAKARQHARPHRGAHQSLLLRAGRWPFASLDAHGAQLGRCRCCGAVERASTGGKVVAARPLSAGLAPCRDPCLRGMGCACRPACGWWVVAPRAGLTTHSHHVLRSDGESGWSTSGNPDRHRSMSRVVTSSNRRSPKAGRKCARTSERRPRIVPGEHPRSSAE